MPEEFTGGLGERARRRCASSRRGRHADFSESLSGLCHSKSGSEGEERAGRRSDREFYSPGSLLNVVLDTQHPLTLGLPGKSRSGPSKPGVGDEGRRSARYPDGADSGIRMAAGRELLAGQAALVDARLGKGHVILFGMRPQYRGQSYQTFKTVFQLTA